MMDRFWKGIRIGIVIILHIILISYLYDIYEEREITPKLEKIIALFDNRDKYINNLDLTALLENSKLEDIAIEKISKHEFFSLCLKNNSINSSFFEKLISQGNIYKLDVSHNKINENVIKLFEKHLNSFKITELDISFNEIKTSQFKNLLKVLQHSSVHTLHIGNYETVSDKELDSFLSVFAELKNRKNFRRIRIEWKLTYQQIKKLDCFLNNLGTNNPSSEEAKFEVNFHQLTDEQWQALSRRSALIVFKENQYLIEQRELERGMVKFLFRVK